jgi:2-amino-4-hydroxy-6-hydroxymethyldihydropteridine diphosphokinase
MHNTAYLLTGSNLGDRHCFLERARQSIASAGELFACSSVYETEPWGMRDQDAYLNQAIGMYTTLEPRALMTKMLEIESLLGRQRREKNGPRNIDIDILLFNDLIAPEGEPIIPHPRLHMRRFVLVPLAEIAGELKHPVYNKSIFKLLDECEDPLDVQKITDPVAE